MKKPVMVALMVLLATMLGAFADQWAFDHLFVADVYGRHEWAQCLKDLGTLYPWLAAAVLVFLLENRRQAGLDAAPWPEALRRALRVVLSPTVAGALTAVVKLVVRRPRPPRDGHSPIVHLFDVVGNLFRPGAFTHDAWMNVTVDNSFPSGHTTVSFAAAFALARLYSRTAWVWYALAAGCALTRVMDRAHHLSDVVFAAGVGWFAAAMVAWGTRKSGERFDAWCGRRRLG